MRVALLAAAAALAAAQAPVYYVRQNYDAPSEDIVQMPGASVAQLEAACNNRTDCVGFNTDGWLKNSLQQIQNGQSCDLYIKSTLGQQLMLWPYPVSVQNGTSTVTVSPTLNFVATNPSNDLSAAFTRIQALIFTHALPAASAADVIAELRKGSTAGMAAPRAAQSTPTLTQLTVTVANLSVPLQLGVDESYKLTIPSDGSAAVLSANTIYGAYHGLQTFSQLVRWNADSKVYEVTSTPVTITDAPRFSWRGILIDTDRHFLPLSTIYSIIDSLTYAHLNVLHWHIVDWQSWPMESAAYPLLWNAAWSRGERYTFEDVAGVVEYARQRGVRVVPEFDTPGHAGSVCTGYPEVCPSPTCTMPLNPASNDTLPLVQAVLAEISKLTPDTYFHLGGDEVDTSCWTSSPTITAWMNAHNLTADGTYEYFVTQVDSMALALGKVPVRWEEVWKHFRTDLDPRTVIHVWLSSATMADVTNNGYYGIWSVDGLYYLDDLSETWQGFYNVDVLGGLSNVTAHQFVLGGEAEMWGETADGSDVLQTIWPRTAAVAERLWSYNVVSNATAPGVAERLAEFRCRLLSRGIPAAPLNNADARTAPPGPGGCFYQ